MSVLYFTNNKGLKLAFVHNEANGGGKNMPALVFLGGLKSDMEGSKALFLEEQCRDRGQEFLRLDYSGHGKSEGAFVEGTIGEWLGDACAVIAHAVKAPEMIVVGSSMGGWIALRLLIDKPEGLPAIKCMIGIAAAPDFTKDIMAQLTPEELVDLKENGRVVQPSDYDEPYIFTRELFDDGEKQSLLAPSNPYKTTAVITLLQGKEDAVVPWKKALLIKEAFDGPRIEVIFVDDGDHSLSEPGNLSLLDEQISLML